MLIKDDFRTYEQRMMRRIKAGDEYKDMINKLKKSKKGVFSEEIKNKFGTIYTPEFVVEKTCELAFKYIPKDTDLLGLTYCDPAAGDGNFLIYLYHRLMKVENGLKPIEKSEHILTKCLFGVEILKPMHLACKLRLLNEHLKLGGDLGIFDRLNISWGNTIMVPEDVGKWEIKEYEGGLLPEEIRNRKYDVIVGNPPYGHLKNQENRIYKAYPKQRDMAQVFVRWGMDHSEIISFNTTTTWLDTKIVDGSLYVRKLLLTRIKEIIINEEIRSYSQGDGGNTSTAIFIITADNKNNIYINNENYPIIEQDLLSRGFIKDKINKTEYPFRNISISTYCGDLHSLKCEVKHGKNPKYREQILFDDNIGNSFYIVTKQNIACKKNGDNYQGSYKLFKTCDNKFIKNQAESLIKYSQIINKDFGLWVIGYLSTKTAFKFIESYTLFGDTDLTWTTYQVSSSMFKKCQVPNFDYYKVNHPKKFTAYMTWIEQNMKDKDVFLTGIDEQFQKLIGE